ncbi:MAG: ABC transporter permease subunit, partial [Alphaproteobacteria bacterium]|nr:ABC transporter permease subunit [Alphaproteobacteria bacterium]
VAPIGALTQEPISLEPSVLPEYALRTTLRMLLAVGVSLLFTLLYAPLAAKSRKAGQILIPLLDVLQSVPVLGYISFTVAGFIALFPGRTLGVECAAIFAIFTSQAWNMTFSLYYSMLALPKNMHEVAAVYKLSGWQKFWKMELPFAMPGLIWNMMVSMSGGWFFVVASEAITVGEQRISLPGIGSYIALAIAQRNMWAIGYAIATMMVVILLYDQLLFRPLLAWADRFRYEMTAGAGAPKSWVLTLFAKSRLGRLAALAYQRLRQVVLRIRLFKAGKPMHFQPPPAQLMDGAWYALVVCAGLAAGWQVGQFLLSSVTTAELLEVLWLALATLTRVVVLILIASLIWVPLGVYIGLRPRASRIAQPLAQFLSAFPANLLFPPAVLLISHYDLSPNIWLSPLMILGTQWYILFNVIGGTSGFPNDLKESARNLRVKGWLWWKKVILPGVFPHYLTGALAASGGAWNASIVSEVVSWGDRSYTATGLGAYIALNTQAGNISHIVLGVGVMALTVVLFNHFVWRNLYMVALKKLRLD